MKAIESQLPLFGFNTVAIRIHTTGCFSTLEFQLSVIVSRCFDIVLQLLQGHTHTHNIEEIPRCTTAGWFPSGRSSKVAEAAKLPRSPESLQGPIWSNHFSVKVCKAML